jgi:hypothetical protein
MPLTCVTAITLPLHLAGLSPEARVQLLIQQYGGVYDSQVGARQVQMLQLRDQQLPAELNGEKLGQRFPLMGYRSILKQLAASLANMLLAREADPTLVHPDSYTRENHLHQLIAAPGMGKTTAATTSWAALYHAYTNIDKYKALLPELSPAAAAALISRVKNTFAPDNFLVFSLPLISA